MTVPPYDQRFDTDEFDGGLPLRLTRRVDAPCDAIGFAAPPVPIQMSFSAFAGRTAVMVLTPPGRAAEVGEWLQHHDPAEIELGNGLAPKSIIALFDQLPDAWSHLLATMDVRHIELRPEGAASLFVTDARNETAHFVDNLPDSAPTPGQRRVFAGPGLPPLTARQHEVLSLAVALGYYELPHKLNVRDLAKRLGMSVGATSEIMRRGESIIMNSHFDRTSLEQWDARHAKAMQDRARSLLVGRHGQADAVQERMLVRDVS